MNRQATNRQDGKKAWRLRGLGAFAAVCLGQTVSLFGSHLTSFVLGIWIYQQMQSASSFSLIAFFAIVPEIVLSPIAGAMVDRWDRRWVMIAGNLGAALCSLTLIWLARNPGLAIWHICFIVAVSSAFQSVQFPALSSAITLLVRAPHRSRANGAMEIGNSVALIAAPAVAGLCLSSIGFTGIFFVNVITFSFAIVMLFISCIPSAQAGPVGVGGLLRDAVQGWLYLRQRRELLALLALFAITNFTAGTVQVLFPPLILSFASPAVLGTVMSCVGGGVLAGSILISLLPGPRFKVRAILGLISVQGMILFLGALKPSVLLAGGAALIFSVCEPITNAISQTIWQSLVPMPIQGRAFAIRKLVAWSSLPIAYLAAGPLSDKVFEPLLTPTGPLSGSLGLWIGVGRGRGIAFLFTVMGALVVAAVIAAFNYRPFSGLESRLLATEQAANEEQRNVTREQEQVFV